MPPKFKIHKLDLDDDERKPQDTDEPAHDEEVAREIADCKNRVEGQTGIPRFYYYTVPEEGER